MSERLLEFSNVSLAFKGVKALMDVSFTVDEHELFAVIGPNGAGKTSTFNCLNGYFVAPNYDSLAEAFMKKVRPKTS